MKTLLGGASAEPEAEQHVVTPVEVELPTVGRIVHFRIDPGSGEPTLRPALVLDTAPDGRLLLQVFVHPGDIPVAYGTNMARSEYLGGYFAEAPFGAECGEWRWPDRLEEPETFVATV